MATKKPATTKQAAAVKPKKARSRKATVPVPAPAPQTIADRVYAQFDHVLAAWASGDSLDEIGLAFEPQLMGIQVRLAISSDKEMAKRFAAVREHRAHTFMEIAAEQLKRVSVNFGPKEKGQLAIQLAEKTEPTIYGNKVAVVGVDGGPLEVTLKLSPTDAYKKMLGLA